MAETYDRRVTPARPDLAAEYLRGHIQAERYAEARPVQVRSASIPLRPEPDAAAAMDTQLLYGERFDVYDAAEGWVWGQATADGYVGYAPEAAFAEAIQAATHRVSVPATHVYGAESIKTEPVGMLWMTAGLAVAEAGAEFARLEDGVFVPAAHIAPADSRARDFVAVAEMFLHVPYLWGGKTAAGLDCSGLVQVALARAGIDAPRDSDMQAAALGEPLAPDAPLERGDLVFWKGHVGIMVTGKTLLHATAHSMRCVKEPLARVRKRIEDTLGIPQTGIRRIPAIQET